MAPKRERILHLRLKLRWDTKEEDWKRAHAALTHASIAGFSSVCVSVPSNEDKPAAFQDPIVHWFLGLVGNALTVYWCRDLWPSHQAKHSPEKLRHWMPLPSYYSTSIAFVKHEARYLNCRHAIDAEKYGPHDDVLKADYPQEEQDRIRDAIERGVEVAGSVDIVFPYGHGSQQSLNWCWDPLGKRRMTETTYRKQRPFNNPPVPPVGFPAFDYLNDPRIIIGQWVDSEPARFKLEGDQPLTPYQWHTHDWTGSSSLYCYVGDELYEKTLEDLARKAGT